MRSRRWVAGMSLLLVASFLTVAIVTGLNMRDNSKNRIIMLSAADRMMANGRPDDALFLYMTVANQHYPQMDKWNKIVSTMAYNSESFVFSSYYDDSNRSNICINRALEIAKETEEPTCICSLFFNIGNYYTNYKDYVSASENYKEALKIAEKYHYRLKAWCAMSQLLYIAIENGNVGTVKDDLKKYLHLFGRDPVSKYNRQIGNGMMNMIYHRYDEALHNFDEARSFLMNKDTRRQFGKLFEDAKQVGVDQAINDYLSQIVFLKSCAMQRGDRCNDAILLMDSLANTIGAQTDKHLLLNIYQHIESLCVESGSISRLNSYKRKVLKIENIYNVARNSCKYRKAIKSADTQELRNEANGKRMTLNRSLFFISILMLATILICLAWSMYNVRNKRKIHANENKPSEKYKLSNLAETEKDDIYNKIIHVMNDSMEIYQTGFSLVRLATMIGVHERWVSQVINERCGMNFSALLNEYRVREFCRRAADTNLYSNLTLGAIGESVGFTSRTYFTKVFKKIMSMSPSDYYKKINR